MVGLLMETLAEKKWFKNITAYRRWESAKCWGEWLVILGIVVEIVVAGWFAKDEWQTIQIAKENDPLNQPITDIFAMVEFRVNKSDFSELPIFGNPNRVAGLTLVEPPSPAVINRNGGNLTRKWWDLDSPTLTMPILGTDRTFDFPLQGGQRTYFMQFHSDEEIAAMGAAFGELRKMIKVSSITNIDTLRLEIKPLPHDLKVLGGTVRLVVNNSILRVFDIPPQIDNREDNSVPDIYSKTTPFVILAFLTNSATNFGTYPMPLVH